MVLLRGLRLGQRLVRSPAGLQYVQTRQQSSSGGFGGAFGDFLGGGNAPNKDVPAQPSQPASDTIEAQEYNSNRDLRKHPWISERLHPKGVTAAEGLLSPLKRALFEKVLEANGGKYVNNSRVELDGRTYTLRLSHEEQNALIPSVYVQSYRIKSSWKKMYMFLRMYRRMPLDDAITQAHFSARRMATDVAEMLERGRKDAVNLGLDPKRLFVDQIWVGKDGNDIKRMQAKGRGRTGVIKHPYVHVKAVLKDKLVQEQRAEWFKARLDRKLWFPLRHWKIKEDFVQTSDYKW